MIVIVDGLDSAEQRKVLTVLETVHTLFSDPPGAAFIILLAVDPHIIAKAIESNLSNSTVAATAWIGGQAYLRNMVHLPFFLQARILAKIIELPSVADPGSGAFLPPGSGSGMNFSWISDPGSRGYRMFFGEIFFG
jgi:hypothetical protein